MVRDDLGDRRYERRGWLPNRASRSACEFVRLAHAEGEPQLGPLFCAWDVAWIEAIDPAKHRLTFVRPTTIADGCDRCRFYWGRM